MIGGVNKLEYPETAGLWQTKDGKWIIDPSRAEDRAIFHTPINDSNLPMGKKESKEKKENELPVWQVSNKIKKYKSRR